MSKKLTNVSVEFSNTGVLIFDVDKIYDIYPTIEQDLDWEVEVLYFKTPQDQEKYFKEYGFDSNKGFVYVLEVQDIDEDKQWFNYGVYSSFENARSAYDNSTYAKTNPFKIRQHLLA